MGVKDILSNFFTYIWITLTKTSMIDGTLLIVDDNRSVTESLEIMLRKEVAKLITLNNPNRLHEILHQNQVDIVLLDMNFRAGISSGNEGMYWMREILKYDENISIIMITAYGDLELAVRAIREGAFDFILKPWDNSKLMATLGAAWKLRTSRIKAEKLEKDNRQLKHQINSNRDKLLTGTSDSMKNVMNIVRKVADTDANILIQGENGTGKEMIAREIHNLSSRRDELMVSVDMGSIPDTLFESEMFGHVKGAFTDAREDRAGRFEVAVNGTLFLDEIGNISLSSQSKLLNVLQSRQLTRVGSNKVIPVNIRLICATNGSLDEMVRQGLFRKDLLYRINTIRIEIPPLRSRKEDIPVLSDYFLRQYAEKYRKNISGISREAIEKLQSYSWPGNIRELQHTMEKAVIMSEDEIISPMDFELSRVAGSGKENESESLEDIEKKMIALSLSKNNNNLSMTASKLGITRQTLYNKIKKYGL